MPIWLIIALGVGFGVSIFAFIIFIIVKQASRTEAQWRNENPNSKVILSANGAACAKFPGIEGTLRGNGLLILTNETLNFLMWGTDKRLTIPIRNIKFIGLTRKFAGRVGRLPMLQVRFTVGDQLLETAWTLANARAWVDEIERLRSEL